MSEVSGSSNANLNDSIKDGPSGTSASIGNGVTQGWEKPWNTSWRLWNGVSEGDTTLKRDKKKSQFFV